jgi:hypothetical protein
MKAELLSVQIKSDAEAYANDARLRNYSADLRTNGRESQSYKNARLVIDTVRNEFLAGKEVALEDLCQSGNSLAKVYSGYDDNHNAMTLWPADERAQVVFLIGYAALENQCVATTDLLILLL